MKRIRIKIDGIRCNKCRSIITTELEKNKLIKSVSIDENIASIEYNEKLDVKEIIDIINSLEFETKEDYIIKE